MKNAIKHAFKKRNKYNATPTERDGWRFDSKHEAKHYDTLRLLEKAGQVLFFFCQVPIRLPGKTKYVVDFLVFWSNGTVTFEDAKGVKTDVYKIKKRQVEELYPIEIMEV